MGISHSTRTETMLTSERCVGVIQMIDAGLQVGYIPCPHTHWRMPGPQRDL